MYCPNCGNEIKESQKFCTNCGTKVINNKDSFVDYLIKHKVVIISAVSLFIIFIAIIVSSTLSATTAEKSDSSTNSAVLNCKNYEELDTDNKHDWEYYQNYIQCTFDEKLKRLNKEHKITEQDKHFENLEFLFEHIYENSKKYGGGIPDPLPGKYDSMNKIYSAYNSIIYHIT